VHPLEGGLAAWMALRYPVRAVEPPVIPPVASAQAPTTG
jgi:hypothetical protein